MDEKQVLLQSQETINFLSLYSLVASNDSPVPSTGKKASIPRVSISNNMNKYMSRKSTAIDYKITPELSKALGISNNDIINVDGEQVVNIDIENLRKYSRNSVMLQSLTGYNGESPDHFEASKLETIIEKMKKKE